MISVKVREVVLDQAHNPLLLLVDMDESLVLPIGIGFWEAQAIVLKLQGHVPPRPMTHDLLQTLCGYLGATITKIVVNDIRENTFFAELFLARGEEEIVIDSRPSDAIALALTVGAPIYISNKVAAYTVSLSDFVDEDSTDLSDSGESGPHLH